jgi:hypothetical protein
VHKIILCGFSVLPTAELQCRVGKAGPTQNCIMMRSQTCTNNPPPLRPTRLLESLSSELERMVISARPVHFEELTWCNVDTAFDVVMVTSYKPYRKIILAVEPEGSTLLVPKFVQFDQPPYRTPWSSGWQSFVFGRSRVHILARRPAVLSEGFRGFPQSTQVYAGIAS